MGRLLKNAAAMAAVAALWLAVGTMEYHDLVEDREAAEAAEQFEKEQAEEQAREERALRIYWEGKAEAEKEWRCWRNRSKGGRHE